MFTLEVVVGRLLEGRVHALETIEEAAEYSAAALRATKAHDKPLVLCADHRRVAIYSQAVADELARLFGVMNVRLERVAVLVSRSNATLALQLERIVREARNPKRRTFYDVAPALDFLSQSLGKTELERARRFLEEPFEAP